MPPRRQIAVSGRGALYPIDGAYGRIARRHLVVVSAPCVEESEYRRHAHHWQTTGSRPASRAAASAPTVHACVTFPASSLRTTSYGPVGSRSRVNAVARDGFHHLPASRARASAAAAMARAAAGGLPPACSAAA